MKRYICLLSTFIGILSCVPEQATQEDTGEKTVHVTGISLDKTSVTIKEGESFLLEASVTPNNAENKAVFWSSSNDAVAKVSDGKVTGITAGSATITAKTEDGGKTASCSVTVERNLAPSVTVGADNISAISVVLKGKANLSNSASSDLQVGFQYSKSAGILPSNSTIVDAEDADADYNYSTGITGLEPGTTYYYRSFVRQNGKDEYGETKEFKTKELSSMLHTLEASKVSAVSAKLNASLSLTDVKYGSVSMGFYWGSDKGALTENVTASEEENVIVATLSELNPAMEYYFQAFALFDGKEYKEEVVSLTTKDLDSILETKEASEIEATKATLNAKLDLTDVNYGSITYGFYVGTSESDQNSFLKGGSISDNAFTSAMTSLPHKTQYWYKAYVKLDGQVFYGEVKTFTTDVVPVESVSLDKTEYTFNTIGNTIRLNATILPSDATDKSVEWTSSNIDVATVDQDGKVTAIGNGTTTIIVKTKDQGKTASCSINVAQYVTGISLSKTSLSLNEGQIEMISISAITPDNAFDKTVTWTSSDESVATVDQSGQVTALSKGNATIRATTNDGSGLSASCIVTVIRLVSTIELSQTSITIYNGQTETITATVYPSTANNTGIIWTSSNTSVAKVSTNGVVTGIAQGSTTITATAKDGSGVSASCSVEVKQYISGISLSKSSISLNEGQTETLIATVSPNNANNQTLTWNSSDESVAKVDQTGKVTAVSKGTATIRAEAQDGSGKYATCLVTVIRLVSSIVLDKTSIAIYPGQTGTINATVIPSDANNTGIYWTSSNTNIATVSSSGVVTGKSPGYATITAKAKDGSEVETICEVEVKQYVTSISLDKTYIDLVEGDTWSLTASISPNDASDKTIRWTSSDESVASVDDNGLVKALVRRGKTTITASAVDGSGISAKCEVFVHPSGTEDLGLSVLWATSNLSTSGLCANPEDYGDYYAWGETEPKSSYEWDTYKWSNEDGTKVTRYCPSGKKSYWGGSGNPDDKNEFKDYEYVDDAARQTLGGAWRTPSKDEWYELINNCTWTWMYNNNGTGVAGTIVTSKMKGYAGKSIFLPVAGYWGWQLYNKSKGYYLSSTLSIPSPVDASGLYEASNDAYVEDFSRATGKSVRPVSE